MLFGKFSGAVREGVPLAPYTWLQLGGPAKYFAEPADLEQLQEIVRIATQSGLSIRVLGGGSNLLVRDRGFDGLVLHLSAPCFEKISIQGSLVQCGGGTRLAHLITACVGTGLGGLEHLVGIPGTVGGALRSNSSTDEGDIGSRMTHATLLTRKGELVKVSSKEANFSHRRSSLDELLILDAEFELQPGDIRQLTKREQTFWIVKRSKQPNYPTRSALAFCRPGWRFRRGIAPSQRRQWIDRGQHPTQFRLSQLHHRQHGRDGRSSAGASGTGQKGRVGKDRFFAPASLGCLVVPVAKVRAGSGGSFAKFSL